MRTEATQAHMRNVIAENRKILQQKTQLIGQYVDIERGLLDYVQDSEGRQLQAEDDLHDFIVTAPSSRVDRLVCALSNGQGTAAQTGWPCDDPEAHAGIGNFRQDMALGATAPAGMS